MIRKLIIPLRSLRSLKSLKCKRNIGNSNSTTTALVERQEYAPSLPDHPWVEVKGADGIYYWNKTTNETTAIGAARPDPWVKVITKQGVYYHNLATNQTTSLGAPLPPRYEIQQYQQPFRQQQPMTLGRSIITFATLGFGMSIGIAMVNSIFR